MKALIIYDLTGKILSIIYGEGTLPQGVPCMYVDIPENAQIDYIDVTDPENPKAVFSYLPKTDIDILKEQVEELYELDNNNVVILADLIGGIN